MYWPLLLFIPACFALNMAPGPNNLLAMNNGRNYGFNIAFLAGLGRIVAFVIMITLAASGLAAVLYASETLFFTIKMLGAVYLFWLAFKLWRSSELRIATAANGACNKELIKQEFMLAAGNPKAILIFTSFLPQFIDVNQDVRQQFVVLGSLFLLLEMVALSCYALFGIYLSQWFTRPKTASRFNKGCAVLLSLSGFNLLFSKS
ncbi:LysE family translocator [Pseudoalteromonas xiamenensis]|uniref:LysE family translocator n=1 Tax=Pseudoalteromonas xiamenensis TaxID=882626 RepID=A0A975HKS2_9GAMM|nr:LysE family translocator [Pseudoalteromonas xiamenensis]QTH71217.1 LysE family translocator [Pseudoalteromonas xiamenensis]